MSVSADERLEVSTDEVLEIRDVTEAVEAAIPPAVATGTVTVFVPHTTAGVIVNEAERRLLTDLETTVEALPPSDGPYRHDEVDDNAAAHLRATILGESVTIPIADGSPALGTWQSILFVECDGPRQRELHVTTVGT